MKFIHILFTVTDVLKAAGWIKHTLRESKQRGDFKWTKKQRYQSYTNTKKPQHNSYQKHHAPSSPPTQGQAKHDQSWRRSLGTKQDDS